MKNRLSKTVEKERGGWVRSVVLKISMQMVLCSAESCDCMNGTWLRITVLAAFLPHIVIGRGIQKSLYPS